MYQRWLSVARSPICVRRRGDVLPPRSLAHVQEKSNHVVRDYNERPLEMDADVCEGLSDNAATQKRDVSGNHSDVLPGGGGGAAGFMGLKPG